RHRQRRWRSRTSRDEGLSVSRSCSYLPLLPACQDATPESIEPPSPGHRRIIALEAGFTTGKCLLVVSCRLHYSAVRHPIVHEGRNHDAKHFDAVLVGGVYRLADPRE